ARRQALKEMWDNLGRVMAEYPHLKKIAAERVTLEGGAVLDVIREDGQPGIIVSAHMANWEIAGPVALLHGGFELDLVYRAPNNPWADRLLQKARQIEPSLRGMAKSKAGARKIMHSLRENRHVGILIDQKY